MFHQFEKRKSFLLDESNKIIMKKKSKTDEHRHGIKLDIIPTLNTDYEFLSSSASSPIYRDFHILYKYTGFMGRVTKI